MHAALDVTMPHYASAMMTTHQIVDALAVVHTCGSSTS
jgi:hypothetical protein